MTIGPSGVTGGKTEESSVEVGLGGAKVGSPPVSDALGPGLCSAHAASRNAAPIKAERRTLCLLMRHIPPLLVPRPGPIGPANLGRRRENAAAHFAQLLRRVPR